MPRRRTFLLADLLVLGFVAFCVVHLAEKPGLPDPYSSYESLIINGTPLHNSDEIEFYLSTHQVGDEVSVAADATVLPVSIHLVQYQSALLDVADALTAIVIVSVGMFVYSRRPEEKAAQVFHRASLLTAMAIAGTRTIFWLGPSGMGASLCALFFLAYSLVSIAFLHFAFVFPTVRWPHYGRILRWLYALGVVIAGWSYVFYLRAANVHSMDLYRTFTVSSMVQNAFGVVLFLSGIGNFVLSYRKTTSTVERKKIRWLLYGLSVGPAPFILLWALPEAFGRSPWISEWAFQVVLLLIPATFAVSILKYRVMDIDVLINRSVVYAIVVGTGVMLYLLVIFVATRLVVSLSTDTPVIIAAAAAALFALGAEPARRRVQAYVDRRFFRVQYNFRASLRELTDELKRCLDIPQLANALVNRIDALLEVERIGFFVLVPPGPKIQPVAHHGFDLLVTHGIRFEAEKLRSQLNLPVALDEKTEHGVEHESGDADVFRRWGMALVFPILSEAKEILGFLVLGPKKSGLRFSADDVDLLFAVTSQAGLAMERITLQKKILLKDAETQRLEELNRLKSYFVSSVSHDLKTPLTSIRMFADILRHRKETAQGEAGEYLEIIEGESDRLTRLINNVLDFARIERGVKEYHFVETDLNELVERTLNTLHYQFKIGGFTVRTELAGEVITLHADPDAITEALVNLLSNAMKYSREQKEIDVKTFIAGEYAAVRIADRGVGISEDELPHVFEPFRRARETGTLGVGGTGLGLTLVKDILDAHRGKIEVESKSGQGSTFTLLLPVGAKDSHREYTDVSIT
jgi:signal transduction histidine kinase